MWTDPLYIFLYNPHARSFSESKAPDQTVIIKDLTTLSSAMVGLSSLYGDADPNTVAKIAAHCSALLCSEWFHNEMNNDSNDGGVKYKHLLVKVRFGCVGIALLVIVN